MTFSCPKVGLPLVGMFGRRPESSVMEIVVGICMFLLVKTCSFGGLERLVYCAIDISFPNLAIRRGVTILCDLRVCHHVTSFNAKPTAPERICPRAL